MPFKSEAQRRYLMANLPDIAAELEAETPAGLALPEHARRGKAKAQVNAAAVNRSGVVRAGNRRR